MWCLTLGDVTTDSAAETTTSKSYQSVIVSIPNHEFALVNVPGKHSNYPVQLLCFTSGVDLSEYGILFIYFNLCIAEQV